MIVKAIKKLRVESENFLKNKNDKNYFIWVK